MIDSIVATTPATSATTIVARAPTRVWEKMSWPRLVVPNQWCAEGVKSGANEVLSGL
jgi:hypothetical protein